MGSANNGSDTPGPYGQHGHSGQHGQSGPDGGSGPARQTGVARMRHTEQARARRNRVLVAGASAVAVAALVVGGVVLVRGQSGSGTSGSGTSESGTPQSGTSGRDSGGSKGSGQFVTGADGVKEWKGTLGREHVTTSVEYPTVPPVGGDHHQAWMNCDGDVYTEAVRNENAVHSMEHGAVWVTYSGEADRADVDALAAKVEKTPYTLMSPVDGQPGPIMMSAWGHQRTVSGADDPRVDAFFEKFVQGAQTPEPGAACTGGLRQ
jgi:hypothetical protein